MGRSYLSLIPMLLLITSSFAFTADDNTAFYVKFNECAGSTLTDTAFGITGTNYGNPTWLGSSDCYEGCCLQYDGINDYSVFLDQSNLDQAGNFAIAYWVKDLEPTSADAKRTIVGKPWALDASNPNYHAFFEASNAGEFTYRTGTTQRSAGLSHDVDSNYQCFVISKNATHVDVYKDGAFVASTALAGNANANNNPLYIAYHGSAGGFVETWSNIIIDNLVIENTTVNVTWAESFCDYTPLSCANKCSDWIAQDNCTLGQQLWKRTCLGTESGCDLEKYNATNYCGLQYNISQGIFTQEYTHYSQDYSCGGNPAAPPAEFNCNYKENIPYDCTNISVTISAAPNWNSVGFLDGCDKGNWTLRACNPDKTSDCSLEIRNCTDLNASITRTYSNYLPGQIATGSAMMKVDYDCRCYLYSLFFNALPAGINSYSLLSNFHIECDQPYTNEWVCDSVNYEKYQQIDGTYTNVSQCADGCNNETGRCYTSFYENPGSPSGFTYWLNAIISPNKNQKIVQALIWSFLIGCVGTIVLNKSTKNSSMGSTGIIFLICFGIGIILFTLIGWLPIWIIITIALFGMGGIALSGFK